MHVHGLDQIGNSSLDSSRLLKRALKALVKRRRHESEDNNEKSDDDLNDLFEFLEYLMLRRRMKLMEDELSKVNVTSSDYAIDSLWLNSSNHSGHGHTQVEQRPPDEFELPVALVQLSILVLVFLIVLCMCKCNQMMEWCRDCRHKQSIEQKNMQYDEDGYHDQMNIRDYLCFMWYNFKKRRRLNRRRRRRRLKNLKNARRFGNVNAKAMSREEEGRKDSLIFKRRSVIYRNKHRKTAAAVPTSAAPSGNSRALKGSFSSNHSVKRSVKFRPNTSFSQASPPNATTVTPSSVSTGDEQPQQQFVTFPDSTNPTINSESGNSDVVRLKKNLSIYFENQVEDIV